MSLIHLTKPDEVELGEEAVPKMPFSTFLDLLHYRFRNLKLNRANKDEELFDQGLNSSDWAVIGLIPPVLQGPGFSRILPPYFKL